MLERCVTDDEALLLGRWRYEPPFDFYDGAGDDDAGDYTLRDERGYGYYPVVGKEGIVGFVCFGAEARVPGQMPAEDTCDVGAGLRPDLLSRGVATSLMPQVLAFAQRRFSPRQIRAAIATFNERSMRLCRGAGFVVTREFDGPRGQRFAELTLVLTQENDS